MAFEAEHLASGFAFSTGKQLTTAEATRWGSIFDNRQELLAYLIVREKAFDGWPAIMAKLREVAATAYALPRTPRTEQGDAVQPQAAALAAARAIEELLASESARISATDTTHDTLSEVVRGWKDAATHPGYHWCVGNEPRS